MLLSIHCSLLANGYSLLADDYSWLASRTCLFILRIFIVFFQMTASIETGLLLMIVGMSTVFVVLGIVVYTGKMLILTVNRFAGGQPGEIHQSADSQSDPTGAKIAAITSAIQMVTGGEGHITNIERLE